jgi:hypothetical protein
MEHIIFTDSAFLCRMLMGGPQTCPGRIVTRLHLHTMQPRHHSAVKRAL